jgi:hypothetical protein
LAADRLAVAQKWLGLSEQRFPKDKWIFGRVNALGNAHES